MDYKTIIVEKEGQVAWITLNRPEKLNTWDFVGQGGITDEFQAALTAIEQHDDVKAVVIRGAGRCFSAGHDLTKVGYVYGMEEPKPGEPAKRRASQRTRLNVDRKFMYENYTRLFYYPKITIAQVHGYCIGEGMIIVSCCDMAIASEDAQLGYPNERLGFAGSGLGTMTHLYLTVGMKRATELLLTGRTIDGKEAERIGLITKAVPRERLDEAVKAMAEVICLLPRDGIAIGKANRHLLYDSLGLTTSFIIGYITHTLFTNIRWEPDELSFFKGRRDKGAKAAFHERDARYADLLDKVFGNPSRS